MTRNARLLKRSAHDFNHLVFIFSIHVADFSDGFASHLWILKASFKNERCLVDWLEKQCIDLDEMVQVQSMDAPNSTKSRLVIRNIPSIFLSKSRSQNKMFSKIEEPKLSNLFQSQIWTKNELIDSVSRQFEAARKQQADVALRDELWDEAEKEQLDEITADRVANDGNELVFFLWILKSWCFKSA